MTASSSLRKHYLMASNPLVCACIKSLSRFHANESTINHNQISSVWTFINLHVSEFYPLGKASALLKSHRNKKVHEEHERL